MYHHEQEIVQTVTHMKLLTTYDGCIGKWSIAHHMARAWANVLQQWVVTS